MRKKSREKLNFENKKRENKNIKKEKIYVDTSKRKRQTREHLVEKHLDKEHLDKKYLTRGRRYRFSILSCFLSLIVITSCCSGCGAMTDIENWDYVLTLGVDKSSDLDGNYEFTFGTQYKEGEGDQEKDKVNSISIKAPTLNQGIKKYEKTHSHTITMGHLVAVIFGDELISPKMKRVGPSLHQLTMQLKDQTTIPLKTKIYCVDQRAKDAMNEGPFDQQTLGEYTKGVMEHQEKNDTSLKDLYACVWKQNAMTISQLSVKKGSIKKIERCTVLD